MTYNEKIELAKEFASKHQLRFCGYYPDGDLQFDGKKTENTRMVRIDDEGKNEIYKLSQISMRIYTGKGKSWGQSVSYGIMSADIKKCKLHSGKDVDQGRIAYVKGSTYELDNVPLGMYQDILDLLKIFREEE